MEKYIDIARLMCYYLQVMKNNTLAADALKSTSHWFTDQKEEVYFTVTVTLPRVGLIEAKFTADRYVASFYNHDTNTSTDGWTNWRVICSNSQSITGVGPKTIDVLYAKVKPMVLAWLASAEYASSRGEAVARFIKRFDNKYNLPTAKRFLVKYVDDISLVDYERIMRGINLLEEGYAALEG